MMNERSRKMNRFSLYLSSQLMCGVTKILSYQIVYHEKELFEIQKILESATLSKMQENNFDVVRALDYSPVMELPMTEQRFLDPQVDKDLYILPGEILEDNLHMIRQDAVCLNFGALTDEEMDFMLEHNGDITFLPLKEKMQITDDSKQKNTTEMITDADIREEIYQEMLSPRAVPTPMIVDISEMRDKTKPPSTPRKRQSRQQKVETPTKKRRFSFEENAPAAMIVDPIPLDDMAVLDSELHAQDAMVTVPFIKQIDKPAFMVQHKAIDMNIDIEMELQSICSKSETFVIKKKTKIIDKKIILDEKIFKKTLQDIKIYCRKLAIPQIRGSETVIDLFNRPSYHPMRWSVHLRDLFVNNIAGPFVNANEDIPPMKLVQYNEMQSQEAIRELQGTIDVNYKEQTTSKLIETGKQEFTTTEELSAIPIQDLCITDKTRPEMKIDVSVIDDTLEDIEVLLEKQQISSRAKDIVETPTGSTEKSHVICLTSQDILAMLEVLWHDRQYVKFSELISKETYTREDAATAFQTLLKLHAQKKLVLRQAAFYRTLWIYKYENYYDEM